MRPVYVALCSGWLAACAAFGPKLATPTLSITDVQLVKSDLFEQRLKVRMRVQNPNDRELSVKGITYAIEVAGERFGNGMSGSSFIVPRLGEAEFDMLVTANMAGTLIRLLGRADKSHGAMPDTVDYKIDGKVMLAKGLLRSIPFTEKGTFKLK